jgi:hypothetical protein
MGELNCIYINLKYMGFKVHSSWMIFERVLGGGAGKTAG